MSKIDISGYLVNRFGAVYRNENWRMNCPFCSDNQERLGISIEKSVAHCFKCGYTSSAVNFVKQAEDVSLSEAYKIIYEYAKITPKSIYRAEPTRRRLKPKLQSYVPLRKSTRPFTTESLARKYLMTNRRMTSREIKLWQIGLSNDKAYLGRVIIPFIENKKWRYFTARKFLGGGPKYLNPPKGMFEDGKSDLLYNISIASKYDEVIIVEGVFDVFATGFNAVAISGKNLSDVQFSKLILSGFKKATIMLDSDAKEEAYEMASRIDEIIPTNIINIKKGDPASNRDPLGGNIHKGRPERFKLSSYLRKKIGKFRR